MTNQNSGGRGYYWYSRAQDYGDSAIATRATRDFRNYMSAVPLVGNDGKRVPGVMEVTVTIANLSGGLNRVFGIQRQPSVYYPFSDLDRIQSSAGILTHDLGVACLAPLSTLQTIGATDFHPLASTTIFGQHVIGHGAVANQTLLVETSATNAALQAVTYNAGAAKVVNYLANVVIAGANKPPALAVCKANGGLVEILTDLVLAGPTSAGNMHANTANCWGILNSPLNSANPGCTTLMIYAGASLSLLDSTSAIGQAPTVVQSALAAGGFPVGIATLSGVPTRAYWFIPLADQGSFSYYSNGGAAGNFPFSGGNLISTNLEGGDLQIVALPIVPLHAAQMADDVIWVSDGRQVFEVSDKIHNLYWATQRRNTADFQRQCMGFFVADGYGHVISVNGHWNTASLTTIAVERYDPATNAWHQASADWAAAANAIWPVNRFSALQSQYVPGAPGAWPYSPLTRNVHAALYNSGTSAAGKYERVYVSPPGMSPYYNANDTTSLGSSPWAVNAFETTGTVTSSAMLIEGLEGLPFVLEEAQCHGDMGGNADAQVVVQVAKQQLGAFTSNLTFTGAPSITFTGNDPPDRMKQPSGDMSVATRFQYKVTVNRSVAGTQATPNALPLIFKLLVFQDGRPRTPAEARDGK